MPLLTAAVVVITFTRGKCAIVFLGVRRTKICSRLPHAFERTTYLLMYGTAVCVCVCSVSVIVSGALLRVRLAVLGSLPLIRQVRRDVLMARAWREGDFATAGELCAGKSERHIVAEQLQIVRNAVVYTARCHVCMFSLHCGF